MNNHLVICFKSIFHFTFIISGILILRTSNEELGRDHVEADVDEQVFCTLGTFSAIMAASNLANTQNKTEEKNENELDLKLFDKQNEDDEELINSLDFYLNCKVFNINQDELLLYGSSPNSIEKRLIVAPKATKKMKLLCGVITEYYINSLNVMDKLSLPPIPVQLIAVITEFSKSIIYGYFIHYFYEEHDEEDKVD